MAAPVGCQHCTILNLGSSLQATLRVGFLGLVLAGFAADAILMTAMSAPPEAADIARAIKQLGDDRFRVREEASAFLWKAGQPAEAALEDALFSQDREIVRRARAILDKFRWGLYPDTPAEIAKLIHGYRTGDSTAKAAAMDGLLRLGKPGHTALLKMATAEEDSRQREWFWQRLSQEVPKIVQGALFDDYLDLAEQVLELSSRHDGSVAIRNYAACVVLRGTSLEQIARWRRRVEAGGDPHSAEVLTYLYRGIGDLPAARWAAEQAGDEVLVDSILEEEGAWSELAQRLDLRMQNGVIGPDDYLSQSYRAAYHRLAGHPELAESAVAAVLRTLEPKGTTVVSEMWYRTEALLVNERPEEALAALRRTRSWSRAFELLAAQGRYAEAFAVGRGETADLPLLIARARTLSTLGEKEEAQHALRIVADQLRELKDSGQLGHFEELLRTELRLGLRPLAVEQVLSVIEHPERGSKFLSLLDRLYPDSPVSVEFWFKFLRHRFPQESLRALLGRLDRYLVARPTRDDVIDIEKDWEKHQAQFRPEEREQGLTFLATLYEALDQPAEARKRLEQAAAITENPQVLRRLGTALAREKRWKEAADRFGQAWDKDRSNPSPLYLRGWALVQGGAKEEGEKCLRRARLLPLADEGSRFTFAEALAKQGHDQAMREEHDLIRRLGEAGSWEVEEVVRQSAHDRLGRRDYLGAADAYQRFFLTCLHPSTGMTRTDSYLIVPHFIHHQRARGFLEQGKADRALLEARLALKLLPLSVDVPIDLARGLEKQGKTAELEAMIEEVAARLERVCGDFPQSAHYHNTLAWLFAATRRHLGRALPHATRAVALAPDSSGYLDTLAEIRFQMGQRDEAMVLMRRCLELSPKRHYYREQLRRFEAGNPAAPLPDEGSGEGE